MESCGITNIPSEQVANAVNVFRQKTSKFIFRRVFKTDLKSDKFIEARLYTNDKEFGVYNIPLPTFTEEQIEQNVEYRFTDFTGVTHNRPLKKNDNIQTQITFSSKNFCKFNVLDGSLSLTYVNSNFVVPPRSSAQYKKFGENPQRNGDLLCGFVEVNDFGVYEYSKWFICSEQFYRLWSLICDNDYVPVRTEEQAKKYKSGIKLATNAHKRWFLGLQQKGMGYALADFKKRYWRLRIEDAAIQYVHIYSMLGMIIKHGEVPCKCNIPVTQGYHTLNEWHVPPGFCDLIMNQFCGVTSNVEVKWGDIKEEDYNFPQFVWKPNTVMDAISFNGSDVVKNCCKEMTRLSNEINELNKIIESSKVYKALQQKHLLLQKFYVEKDRDNIIKQIRFDIAMLKKTKEYNEILPLIKQQYQKSLERTNYFKIIAEQQQKVISGKV